MEATRAITYLASVRSAVDRPTGAAKASR